jgi:acyl carrier protein
MIWGMTFLPEDLYALRGDQMRQSANSGSLAVRNETASSSNEIYTRVATVLGQSLNADEEAITPVATLYGDLGAESIDLLDIMFRLEREFGIHIERDELFPASIFQGDAGSVQDGKVTDSGMVRLRSQLPYADFSHFAGDQRVSAISDLFTVGLITRFIAWKLSQGASRDGAVPSSPSPNGQ